MPLPAAHWAARASSRPATAAGSPSASRNEGRNRLRAILAVPAIPHRRRSPIVIARFSPGHYRGMRELFRGAGRLPLTPFHDDGSIHDGGSPDLPRPPVGRGDRPVTAAL